MVVIVVRDTGINSETLELTVVVIVVRGTGINSGSNCCKIQWI